MRLIPGTPQHWQVCPETLTSSGASQKLWWFHTDISVDSPWDFKMTLINCWAVEILSHVTLWFLACGMSKAPQKISNQSWAAFVQLPSRKWQNVIHCATSARGLGIQIRCLSPKIYPSVLINSLFITCYCRFLLIADCYSRARLHGHLCAQPEKSHTAQRSISFRCLEATRWNLSELYYYSSKIPTNFLAKSCYICYNWHEISQKCISFKSAIVAGAFSGCTSVKFRETLSSTQRLAGRNGLSESETLRRKIGTIKDLVWKWNPNGIDWV